MKKLLLVLSLPVLAAALAFSTSGMVAVHAEDGEESEVVEVVDEEEQSALDDVKNWLGQYIDSQMVANIITWCSEAGVLAGLLGVYIKYRKFKGKTIEDLVKLVKAEVGKYLTENFERLSEDKHAKIINAVADLEKAQETIMKVLVLMQDTTTKGKVALLDFLGSKTKNDEVKELAEETQVQLEEEVKKEEVVKEAVKEGYEKIF